MPSRIVYWTSAFEPDMEAISAEVALLRRRFAPSFAWGLSHRHWLLLSRERGLCLHYRLQLAFRAITRLLEPVFRLNHVFGSLGDWFYLQGNRRRPTVLTVTGIAPPVGRPMLDRIDRFVVEWPGARDYLRQIGIETKDVKLIFPPVDVQRFVPAPPANGPFTIVFASSPDRADWLEGRGVPQLLDAAALRPAMRFRLLWRPWGDALPRVRRWVAERGLTNVEVCEGRFPDMEQQYRAGHVTVAPFVDPERCKPAPNSLVESLACGRPVLTTPTVGIAEIIDEARAGLVCAPSGPALADSLDRLQADWPMYAAQSRLLAERQFATERFIAAYRDIYQGLIR